MYPKFLLRALICYLFVSMPALMSIAQQSKFIQGTEVKNLRPQSPPDVRRSAVIKRSHYRTYDGTDNNIGTAKKALWGSANIQLFRELPPVYGPTDKKNAMGGVGRPSPREISNVVCDEPVTQFNSRNVSAFAYVWGQFLDHDMSLTPTDTIESVPIPLPPDETIFTEDIPFTRSMIYPGTGVVNKRQQMNQQTSWIDASMVYGTDSVSAAWMRTHVDGKMKTSSGNYLPWNTVTGEEADAIDPSAPSMANDGGHTTKTFVAGDPRASEHPGLLSLQTLFVREHNRICDLLIAQGKTGDEKLYQTARKEVGALIQAITYQEFLPSMGITLHPYTGYNKTTRPDIANTFATAGYRIGHTMVADEISIRDNNCDTVPPGAFDLVDAFWNPQLVVDYGIDVFCKGNATHLCYETDNKINDVLRNFLFTNPNDTDRFGIDLASLNIQRGRDHGLPDYNTVRGYYTGSKAVNFSDITSDPNLASELASLYGNVDNIDLWVGILAEDHLPNTSVGNTMNAILGNQFERLRDGDFYFYLNDPYLPANIRNQIINTTLADVIERNSSLTTLQGDVFFIDPCPGENGQDVFRSKVESGADFKLYPNPVTNMLNVEVSNLDEAGIIKMFSANGALVKIINVSASQKNIHIDVNSFTPGIYFMNILTGKQTKSFKFVKLGN